MSGIAINILSLPRMATNNQLRSCLSSLLQRKYCLDILIAYLDGYLTSKLWVELREKEPLIYGGDAGYDVYEEGGYFQIVYSLEKKNVFVGCRERKRFSLMESFWKEITRNGRRIILLPSWMR